MASKKPVFFIFIFICLLAWLGGLVVFSGLSILRTPQHLDKNTDAIVVLTGGDQRIEAALMLFAAGKSKELFISGVHQDVTENDIRALWKGGMPVPECCITLGRNAVSTLENAMETREWIGQKHFHSIRLVTANYHMNRSLLHFSALLPGVEIIPYPVEQPGITVETKKFWQFIFTEYHKTLFRLVSAPVYYLADKAGISLR